VKCGECSIRLWSDREIKYHQARVHGGELPYKCPVCGVGKKFPGALSHQMASVHNQGEKKRKKKQVTCEVCGKVVAAEYFETHMKIHLEVKDKAGPIDRCLTGIVDRP